MRTFGILLAALAFSMAEASAQDRRPLVGVVRGADGAPLSNATVCCAFVPPGFEGDDAFDLVCVRADSSGRFRALVLPCAIYRVWAIGPVDGDGRALVSRMVDSAAAQPTDLAADYLQRGLRLRLAGLDAWTGSGPFRVRCLPNGVHLPDHVFPVAADGAVAIPPMPQGYWRLQLLDTNGEVLDAPDLDVHGDWTWRLDAPTTLAFVVVDGAGAPVAGAEVWQLTPTMRFEGNAVRIGAGNESGRRRLGATGVDGTLTAARVARPGPFAADGGNRLFAAHKPGAGLAWSGWYADRTRLHSGIAVRCDPSEPIRFELRGDPPVRVRIVRGAYAAAAVQLRFCAQLSWRFDERGFVGQTPWTWAAATDADGVLTCDALPPDDGMTVHVAISAGLQRALATDAGLSMPPQPLAQALTATNWRQAAAAKVDLAALHLVRVRVLDENDGPARSVQVLVLDESTGYAADAGNLRATPDSAGRLALLASGAVFVFAADAQHAGWALIRPGNAETTQRLHAMSELRGTLVDAAGSPVAGARLSIASIQFGDQRGQDAEAIALENACAAQCTRWVDGVFSDPHGGFVVHFVESALLHVQAAFDCEEGQSEPFLLAPQDGSITVKLGS